MIRSYVPFILRVLSIPKGRILLLIFFFLVEALSRMLQHLVIIDGNRIWRMTTRCHIFSVFFYFEWFHEFCQYRRRKWQPTPGVLAWRIPRMGEPGGLPSMGSHRVGHNWSDLAAAAAAVSGIQQNYLVIHFYIFFFRFLSLICYYSVLNRVPSAYIQ